MLTNAVHGNLQNRPYSTMQLLHEWRFIIDFIVLMVISILIGQALDDNFNDRIEDPPPILAGWLALVCAFIVFMRILDSFVTLVKHKTIDRRMLSVCLPSYTLCIASWFLPFFGEKYFIAIIVAFLWANTSHIYIPK